jgi:hypothetical protein
LALDTPGGKMNMVVNGDRAVIKMPQGTMPLPEAQKKDLRESMGRDVITMWQNLDRYQVQFLGKKAFAGSEAIELVVSGSGAGFHLFLDPGTMLPRGMSYQSVIAEGPAMVEEHISDYREVDGIRMPFKTEAFANGKKVSGQAVKTIQFNTVVSDDLFKIE